MTDLTKHHKILLMTVAQEGYGSELTRQDLRHKSAQLDEIDFGIAYSELLGEELLHDDPYSDSITLTAYGWKTVKKIRYEDLS